MGGRCLRRKPAFVGFVPRVLKIECTGFLISYWFRFVREHIHLGVGELNLLDRSLDVS